MDKSTFLHSWSQFLWNIRRFFHDRAYLEVTTPTLVSAGAFEASIDPLTAHSHRQHWQLHTSPEIEMKALLSATKLPIFQITPCFRDDPASPVHFIEFTMLEFYTPDVDYTHSISLMQQLLENLAQTPLPWHKLTVQEAFRKYAQIDLETCNTRDTLLAAIHSKRTIVPDARDTYDDLYFKILIERIEPALDKTDPTLLCDYPSAQAALAKLDPTGHHAERFEIYWKGMEICNGCSELESLSELEARYQKENAGRANPHPFPEKLKHALQTPLRASGVAVGLERLFMALHADSGGLFDRVRAESSR